MSSLTGVEGWERGRHPTAQRTMQSSFFVGASFRTATTLELSG
jgi:hypothetical protein